MTLVADDLMTRARDGDGLAFRELTQPHARELLVHCYRMLGSIQDAEDALQDTLLAAWQGLSTFEGRASLRTWLYRIATNRCLNVQRSTMRRRAREWTIAGVVPPPPSSLGEVVWLEPFPDALAAADPVPGPEAVYEETEAISLAFVRALQLLPRRQVAVLILRDVLGFRTAEVAGMLDTTVESVGSLLKRARARLLRPAPDEPAPDRGSADERAILSRFVDAYRSGDIDALVPLLTDDVFLAMPPLRLEYRGRAPVVEFTAQLFATGRAYDVVQTRANGQPAFGVYTRRPDGTSLGTGLLVLTLSRDRISAMNRFEPRLLRRFDLPDTL